MSSQEGTRTPRSLHSKENLHPRSRSASPRKALAEILCNNIQPSDLVHEHPEEFIEHSKHVIRNLQLENESLRRRVKSFDFAQSEKTTSKDERIDALQAELERLVSENHRLETQLHSTKAEMQISSGGAAEIARLSEELAWHSKLHLYAEKERMRLLDLLEFAGREGKLMVKEAVVLREKLSKLSLRSSSCAVASDGGSVYKCLI